jgi:hypothetical protein
MDYAGSNEPLKPPMPVTRIDSLRLGLVYIVKHIAVSKGFKGADAGWSPFIYCSRRVVERHLGVANDDFQRLLARMMIHS